MNDVDLTRYLKVLWKWAWLLILAAAVAAGVSYRVSQSMPRIYRSSMTLMVGDIAANPNLSPEDLSLSQRLADTYSKMILREPILAATVDALHLPTDWRSLQGRVLVTHTEASQLIEIRVLDNDPRRAKAIVEEIGHQLILQSPTVAGMQQVEQNQEFIRQQMEVLQGNIQQAEKDIAAKQAEIEKETSARAVLDRQDEIKALELKLSDWRSTYATLLTAYKGRPTNSLSVVEPPTVENEPVSPNVRSNVLLAVALSLILATGAVLLIEYLSRAIEEVDDVTRSVGLVTLGQIPNLGRIRQPSAALITVADPFSPISEAIRLLRTNVAAACAGQASVPLVVTSPATHEGKSFLCVNLAVSFAQARRSVILVDADVRHPTVHTYFGGNNAFGLTNILASSAGTGLSPDGEGAAMRSSWPSLNLQLAEHLIPTAIPGLSYLPSGPLSANPAELLGSPQMGQVLHELQDRADIVVVDSPPTLPVADPTLLAGHDVQTLVVVEAGRTRPRDLHLTIETLQMNHARLLGVVLNKVARARVQRYYQYYRPARPSKESSTGAGNSPSAKSRPPG